MPCWIGLSTRMARMPRSHRTPLSRSRSTWCSMTGRDLATMTGCATGTGSRSCPTPSSARHGQCRSSGTPIVSPWGRGRGGAAQCRQYWGRAGFRAPPPGSLRCDGTRWVRPQPARISSTLVEAATPVRGFRGVTRFRSSQRRTVSRSSRLQRMPRIRAGPTAGLCGTMRRVGR
jgi:hypothetical protein